MDSRRRIVRLTTFVLLCVALVLAVVNVRNALNTSAAQGSAKVLQLPGSTALVGHRAGSGLPQKADRRTLRLGDSGAA
jgi:hypothetical protein